MRQSWGLSTRLAKGCSQGCAASTYKFPLLNYGLAVILVFIGAKMCLIDIYEIPVAVSLGVVIGILALTMLLSVRTANVPARSGKT